ncbi:hypothetical protein ABZP36_015838 [Zizania latifolia]
MESRKPPPSALVDNHVVRAPSNLPYPDLELAAIPGDFGLLTRLTVDAQVPGDVVLDLTEMTNHTIKLGTGLRQDCDTIQATGAGRLRLSKPNMYWVESSQKRYVPFVEDTVLCVVVDTKPDNFLVDIKGPNLAFLPVLAFEGGTRRNIPKFEIGTLIYARVVNADSIMNPELSCMDATGKAAEFGQLKDGYMFNTSTGLSRMLLSSPTCPVLQALGKKLSFEIAVGLNGRVWVNAPSPSNVIVVSNAIIKSESLSGIGQQSMNPTRPVLPYNITPRGWPPRAEAAHTALASLAFPLPPSVSGPFSSTTLRATARARSYSGGSSAAPDFSRCSVLQLEIWCPDLAMGGTRFEIDTNKCGTHSAPSKPYYVDTVGTDAQKIVRYQVNCRTARDRNAASYPVKHHFPSPIVSWIEDLSSFGDVSFSPDPEYVDEQSRSSVGQSSASVNLHDMQISVRLTDEFMELAKENTSNNVETCGILGASFRDGTYYVTMLIIPKQEATAHSCQAVNEEEIHAILSEQSLYPAGWIHTHPSQTCFLSSIDLHTQYSYQVMLPEAVAIVVAPTDPTRSYGIFRLADPGGMNVLRECSESGFHAHRETTDGGPIYETCSKVHFKQNLRFEIVDLRSAPGTV